MAWQPDDMISGWSEDGTTISFPIASLEPYGLTVASADGVTGDARQVALSLCSRFVDWYQNLADQPENMSATISSRRLITTGDHSGEEFTKFQHEFYTDYSVGDVAPEPIAP